MNMYSCPACLKELVDPRALPCRHTYCQCCLQMMMTKRNRIQCHICKAIHRTGDEREGNLRKGCKRSSSFSTERKSREVERKSCTSCRQQREKEQQRREKRQNRQSRQSAKQSKKSAASDLNNCDPVDFDCAEVKSLQDRPQQKNQEEIGGALVAKSDVDSTCVLQQQWLRLQMDDINLSGSQYQPHQPEAENHVATGIVKDMSILMMKIGFLRSFYRKSCCHGCGFKKFRIVCARCKTAKYCSVKCFNRDLDFKHLMHCTEMLKLMSEVREKHFEDFFLPQLYREKLSLLMSEYDPIRCSGCRHDDTIRKLKICAGCVCAKYCSKSCQIEDWGGKHKTHCTEIGRLRELVYGAEERGFGSEVSRVIALCPDIDAYVAWFIDLNTAFIDHMLSSTKIKKKIKKSLSG